jgi:2,4-dienoyl-CoA reductase-like NADH-dependent reductase (Old Yellow Enzyme family)
MRFHQLIHPQMMQEAQRAPSAKTSAREAFFLDFAKAVRARFPDLKLMVTGGFRSRGGMEAALAENVCDIIGIGRPSVVNQWLPKQVLLNEKVSDEDAQMYLSPTSLPWFMSWVPIKALGAGAESVSASCPFLQL